jgi:hypothetical protein
MASDWSTVEALIRGLGAVRAAANTRASNVDAIVDQAIRDAAGAIDLIPHPGNREAVLRAYDAVRAARVALQDELARSGRIQEQARELREDSQRLIQEAAAVQEDAWRLRDARMSMTARGRRAPVVRGPGVGNVAAGEQIAPTINCGVADRSVSGDPPSSVQRC